MLFAVNLFAQVIPNADMEAWADSVSFEEPIGWGTTNPFGVTTVSKTTDAHSGQFAALLESKSVLGITIAGIMATGVINTDELTVEEDFLLIKVIQISPDTINIPQAPIPLPALIPAG